MGIADLNVFCSQMPLVLAPESFPCAAVIQLQLPRKCVAGVVLHVMGFQLPCSNGDRLHALLLRNPPPPSEPSDQQCAFPAVQSIWHVSALSRSGIPHESVHCSRFAPLASMSLLPHNPLFAQLGHRLLWVLIWKTSSLLGRTVKYGPSKALTGLPALRKLRLDEKCPFHSFMTLVSELLAKGLFH